MSASPKLSQEELASFLNEKYLEYSNSAFIDDDPIQIPHGFSKPLDIEIAGLFAAIFAWGQRKTIINKCNDLLARMDNAPADFILHFRPNDLAAVDGFAHRTFNAEDVKSMAIALQKMLSNKQSLECYFLHPEDQVDLKNGLNQFKQTFVELGIPQRTQRHLPDPAKGSAAKRVNMFLRWMVRKDAVDFGLWKDISPALLSCPLDVHSGRVARKIGLLQRKQNDWKAVEELNQALRRLDPKDPIKYDFALFGLGVYEGVK